MSRNKQQIRQLGEYQPYADAQATRQELATKRKEAQQQIAAIDAELKQAGEQDSDQAALELLGKAAPAAAIDTAQLTQERAQLTQHLQAIQRALEMHDPVYREATRKGLDLIRQGLQPELRAIQQRQLTAAELLLQALRDEKLFRNEHRQALEVVARVPCCFGNYLRFEQLLAQWISNLQKGAAK